MFDEILIASVVEAPGEALGDSKASIQFSDQQTARVGGEAMAVHLYDHRAGD